MCVLLVHFRSLAGERRPSREAVGPLLHAQSLVAELSS